MMGRCKLTSICGCDRCCIECPENEMCKTKCARMDMYEYCVECPEYEEEDMILFCPDLTEKKR